MRARLHEEEKVGYCIWCHMEGSSDLVNDGGWGLPLKRWAHKAREIEWSRSVERSALGWSGVM
ncbi:hypothetical protein DVH24_010607 [Malus domestica]|uniref:Uncharacterized protein n=1 Tax=Malus domestica TaxID=3750 RepID=A0A498JXS6_MALDO|nr:hypothetical protein DVH24_010607 [Malus domestica]